MRSTGMLQVLDATIGIRCLIASAHFTRLSTQRR